MALKANYTDNGIEYADAYIKIMDVRILNYGASKGKAEMEVWLFATEEDTDESPQFKMMFTFEFVYGSDIFVQAYNSLKEEAIFVNVVDAQDDEEPASA